MVKNFGQNNYIEYIFNVLINQREYLLSNTHAIVYDFDFNAFYIYAETEPRNDTTSVSNIHILEFAVVFKLTAQFCCCTPLQSLRLCCATSLRHFVAAYKNKTTMGRL